LGRCLGRLWCWRDGGKRTSPSLCGTAPATRLLFQPITKTTIKGLRSTDQNMARRAIESAWHTPQPKVQITITRGYFAEFKSKWPHQFEAKNRG
jgi:hypothetical protein